MTTCIVTGRGGYAALKVAGVLICAAAAASSARAQFPEKPITILVGYAADSVGDQIARGLAEAAKKHLSQPIVVVNRPGASGTIAISEAVAATPDGYTLGLGTIGNLTVQPHRINLAYGGPDTYVPVAKLVSYPNVLIVGAGASWKNIGEFLGYARTHPGQVRIGVPGVATVAHLNVEQLKVLAGVDLHVVNFDGPEQVAAVVRGQIDAAVAGPAPIIQHIRSGTAVMLGVFGDRRLPLTPDVPTFKELGFDISLGTAQAIVAPAATPGSVVAALEDAIKKAVAEPSFVSLAEKTQNTIDYKGPEAFAAELRQGFESNGNLLHTLGIVKK
jgi:tripartite-type tricarboxylate transporter receptor subunit TctC